MGERPTELNGVPDTVYKSDPIQCYARLLRLHDCVENLWESQDLGVGTERTHQAAVVASKSSKDGLSLSDPVMVARLEGGLVCTCWESRDHRNHISAATGTVEHDECEHVQVARMLPLELREAHPPPNALVEPLKKFPGYVAVSAPGQQISLSVVRRRPHIKCLLCQKPHCIHTSLYRNSPLSETDRDSCTGVGTERTHQVATSFIPRSLPLRTSVQPTPESFSPLREILPEATCRCGNVWTEEVFNPPSGRTVFIDRQGIVHSSHTLCVLKGSGCDCLQQYDGVTEGVFHSKRGVLVDQGLLADIFGSLATATPLASFHHSLEESARVSYKDLGVGIERTHQGKKESGRILSLRDLQNIWASFLGLLQLPGSKAFMCRECGPFPATLVMDGITLGHRKSYTGSGGEPESMVGGSAPVSGSLHRDRIAIPHPETRQRLSEWLKDSTSVCSKTLLTLLHRHVPQLAAWVEEASR